MAYDPGMAERIRNLLADQPGVTEKKMFGGVAFMVDGNMACGVANDEMMLRVGVDGFDELVAQPGVRPFDMTGRPMKGWVLVSHDVIEEDDDLEAWMMRGVAFARSLPPK